VKLIFIDGNCVKRISGDAVPDVPDAMVIDETPEVVGAPLRLVKLIDGVPVVVPPSPPTAEEIAASEARGELDAFMRKAFAVVFDHENRLRALEGKTIFTRQQFKDS